MTVFDGWAVEWRQYTGSFVASPGARADACSWHGAISAQEDAGRHLESLPRDRIHRMRATQVELIRILRTIKRRKVRVPIAHTTRLIVNYSRLAS